jgi:UDP-glucose 4-epimerase
MKRILITGANSYIGTSFENWVKQWPDKYSVETLDMIADAWREKSFIGFGAVFHVAGIAHSDAGKISKATQELYYKINCDLAFETARRAKADDVKQFIYMSSIIVYGENYNADRHITKDTIPTPSNSYGDSKLQAEKRLNTLSDGSFHIVIIRSTMVYGKNCKGNYLILSKIARKVPLFPDINNQRSMIHIDNLCEFIRMAIEYEESGVFFPQNNEYVTTSAMIKEIANAHAKKVVLFRGLNWAVKLFRRLPGKIGAMANKAFGSLTYEMSMSERDYNYRVKNFQESINNTENSRLESR